MTDFRRPLHDEAAPLHAGLPQTPHRSCFDDEIAIDFPSIGPAVERMREGLLEGEASASAHSAAISLSPRQAFAGATVPLDVPVRHTCRDCGGRGETWAEPCGRCDGSGECSRSHQVRVLVPAGVADGARFSFFVATPQGVPTRIEVTVLVA